MDPVTIALISSTVISGIGALVAIFRKNIRNIACFGKNCINFRSGNTPPRGESPSILDLPAIRNEPVVTGSMFHGTPQNQSPPTNININFDHAQPLEEHNSIRISQL